MIIFLLDHIFTILIWERSIDTFSHIYETADFPPLAMKKPANKSETANGSW